MPSTAEKPGRPFGVSLAIFVSVLVFSVVPLLQIGIILLIEHRVNQISQDFSINLPGQEGEIEAFATGGNFRGVSDDRLIAQGVLAVLFLGIACFAWRGRPSMMRYVLVFAVLLLTLITLGLTILPILQQEQRGAGQSGGSLDWLFSSLACGHIVSVIFVPVYVVWYLNRGPARAFYRGYYLPDPEDSQV